MHIQEKITNFAPQNFAFGCFRQQLIKNMHEIWKNYKSTIILLVSIAIGGTVGGLWPESADYLKPIGDIFMNTLFVLIVPMVLFSVASSVCNLSQRKLLGRTLVASGIVVVGVMALVSAITYAGVCLFPPLTDALSGSSAPAAEEEIPMGELIVKALSVTDFQDLLSIGHVLPLMVVALLMGYAASKMNTDRVSVVLQQGSELVMKMMDSLMKLAPIGLGCYFAGMMASGTGELLKGYGRFMALYLAVGALMYFIVNPLLTLLAVGWKGMKHYPHALLAPSLMAISTLSSSATMPTNIRAAQQLGASPAMAESLIPLGTQLFKLGSIICSIMKTAFVMLLMGQDICTPQAALLIICVGLVASVIVGAVPVGAGAGELFTCSVLGADMSVVGLLMVISTIVDMPATLLNATGNTIMPSIIQKVASVLPHKE